MFWCIFPLKHTQLPAPQGPHPRNMCRPAPLSQTKFQLAKVHQKHTSNSSGIILIVL